MRYLSSFSILLTLALLFLTQNLAAALYSSEATEIPYQVDNSDRIVIGTVSGIDTSNEYTITTITVSEWLYNTLPTKTIQVMTIVGLEDEAEFTQNESILLMLKDKRPDKQVFLMFVGSLGKHPVSDRDAVIRELKAQGKWKGEDQTRNKTNEIETIKNTVIAGNQKENVTEISAQENATKSLNENSSNVNNSSREKSSEISSTPGFELIGSLACLYAGWKLRRKE
jgi:hypothetical protein